MRPTTMFLLALVGCAMTVPHASADEQAIRKVLQQQADAWNRGDLEGFMAGYAKSDELTFYSGKDKRRGWRETMERYRKRYQGEGKEMGTVKFSELEFQPLGDGFALAKGRWDLKLSKENPGGLFTLIFQRTRDGWKIIHDHTSG